MARQTTRHVCQSCGAVHPRWAGRCEACDAWNSIVEEAKPDAAPIGGKGGGAPGNAQGAAPDPSQAEALLAAAKAALKAIG